MPLSCMINSKALCHCADSDWRNRDEFFTGREKIREFLTRKWQKEHNYKLKVQILCVRLTWPSLSTMCSNPCIMSMACTLPNPS